MNRGTALIGGASLGAGVMYLLDPDRGKRRRALVRDQAIRSVRKTREAAETTARDARNRAQGVVSIIKSWVSPSPSFTNDVVGERVRAKLGMLVRHPASIEVTVHDGTVVLSGPVLADEVDSLLRMVARISGVRHVDNRLDVHEEAGDVPGLHGGPAQRRRGDVFEWAQSNWSPTARFLMGAGGGIVAMYGARRRTLVSGALAAGGMALLARALFNREFSDLLDIDRMRMERRRGVDRRRGPDRSGAAAGKRVREVMTSDAEMIYPNATVADAAEKMRTLGVGVMPVCDGERLVGMLTDRDIVVRVLADHRDPKRTSVSEAMTPQVAYCFEEDEAQQAARLMTEKQIRRLAVLNRDKRLVGIVSLGDLAVQTEDSRLSGEVLERVSEPVAPRR